MRTISEEAALIYRWTDVYRKLFSKTPDLSVLAIPAKPEGLGPMRLIVVAKEIVEWTNGRQLQRTMDALKRTFQFRCSQFAGDLDTSITVNDRDPRNGSYALWVKDVREADEENANRSVNDLKAVNHQGLTVLERMLLEADYFFEHGEHLDYENSTLCGGSRSSDGVHVPYVNWNGRQFDLGCAEIKHGDRLLRSRTVYL